MCMREEKEMVKWREVNLEGIDEKDVYGYMQIWGGRGSHD